MTANANKKKVKLIAAIANRARRGLGKKRANSVKRFITRYYEHVPPQDVLGEKPDALLGSAMGLWEFASTRRPGRPKIRVFNPTKKEHGWESRHTVVEIVNDDMPFLVDSVTAELNRRDVYVHLAIHPVYNVRRDGRGRMRELPGPRKSGDGVVPESMMHMNITRQSGRSLGGIRAGIEGVLADVRAAVEDWAPMRKRMEMIIGELDQSPSGASDEEAHEVRDFLRWLHDNNFTFTGFREYDFKIDKRKSVSSIRRKTGLGILRDPKFVLFKELRNLASMPPEVRAFVARPDLLLVTKTTLASTVHRPVHMDSIGVKRFDARGRVVGERVFVGLFTSMAYSLNPRDIPVLRRKLQKAFDRGGFAPASHDGKSLLNILETYPRDELFQVSVDHLYRASMGILHLQDRQKVALFTRADEYGRFISCFVYIPRDRYSTDLRQRLQDIMCEAFAGEVAAYKAELGDSPLARLHVTIATTPGRIPKYDIDELETRMAEETRSWSDRMQDALVAAHGEEQGLDLCRRYSDAFPPGYRERFAGVDVVADVAKLDHALESDELGMNLYKQSGTAANRFRFKIYRRRQPVPLSDILPMLEHLGLKVVDEIPHTIRPRGADLVMIHDFGLETRDGSRVDVDATRENFHDVFGRVWRGEVESDGFNELVLQAGLSWRGVVILRAYCKYLIQARISIAQDTMEQTLAKHSAISGRIVDLFMAKFDPGGGKNAKGRATRILNRLKASLDEVESAVEDGILRHFILMVDATLRTNFFQESGDGGPKPYVSIKIDSRKLAFLPKPTPLREIFVYSPRVEGVHLRFGMVARGGLRWSDRRDDFRTEILGLVKAQQVKNAVIVPVGSKGGFYVKQPPTEGGRDAFLKEGIACYETFISGLLDITDNRVGNRVVPPKDVVRLDGNDPYLVVAADKGTATFSDIANGISQRYGFWLGDAFASGGSVGYDHKKMGITARGGWESVKRHFREIGLNTQTEDFTVIGVGDMSGDVFGNGMLLSRHIKMLAAFNHLHIIVDPDPDSASSFKERKRLFNLPRSAWSDYDSKVLSKGGRIFERKAKSLTLTPEIKKRFAIPKDKVTPNELLKILLTAEADLLWFGGIGTYVKAEAESDADVGDNDNNAIRANGGDLRCRVIGEGANLGVTQRGRIEFALSGGRLNTDSIDNSAGVDCSDHEVNIKILVDRAVDAGDLNMKSRNRLLASMTDEVGLLVLRDNYLQTQAITSIEAEGVGALDNQVRLMRVLEKEAELDRKVEYLPDDEAIADRAAASRGLTRPEIAVLLSYAKLWLYDEILDSDVTDDGHLVEDLVNYFPQPLRVKYRPLIEKHQLRREIIATHLTNSLVNRVGATFVSEFMEKTGRAAADIARAYAITLRVFRLREFWSAIDELDNRVPAAVQTSMLKDIDHLIEWVTLWFLRNGHASLDIGEHVAEFAAGMETLSRDLDQTLPAHYLDDVKKRAKPYIDEGVPRDLALLIAGLVNLYSSGDIVRLASRHKRPVADVARLYFAIGTRFRMGRLRAASSMLDSESHWQKLAVAALIEENYGHQLALASQVLAAGRTPDEQKAIDSWIKKNRDPVGQADAFLEELWSVDVNDLSMIAVASRKYRVLTDS